MVVLFLTYGENMLKWNGFIYKKSDKLFHLLTLETSNTH